MTSIYTVTWTSTNPTKTGWYWNRAKPGGLEHRTHGDVALNSTCVFIFEGDSVNGATGHYYLLAPTGKGYRDIETLPEQEWAGPIPEPIS